MADRRPLLRKAGSRLKPAWQPGRRLPKPSQRLKPASRLLLDDTPVYPTEVRLFCKDNVRLQEMSQMFKPNVLCLYMFAPRLAYVAPEFAGGTRRCRNSPPSRYFARLPAAISVGNGSGVRRLPRRPTTSSSSAAADTGWVRLIIWPASTVSAASRCWRKAGSAAGTPAATTP